MEKLKHHLHQVGMSIVQAKLILKLGTHIMPVKRIMSLKVKRKREH